jgi:hypothetical protein
MLRRVQEEFRVYSEYEVRINPIPAFTPDFGCKIVQGMKMINNKVELTLRHVFPFVL